MRTEKNIVFLVGIAVLIGMGAFAHAAPPVKSCSDEDQYAFYQDLLEKDQMLRSSAALPNVEFRDKLLKQDTENQTQLDKIVEACGWPEDSPFSNSKLEAAYLVVQHSSKEFAERYRSRVEAAYAKGLIPQQQMDNFRRYVDLKNRWGK